MYYFIMRDDVANQLTPVFQQNTITSAQRCICKDPSIMELIDDFSIAIIGHDINDQKKVDYFPMRELNWIPLKTFIEEEVDETK